MSADLAFIHAHKEALLARAQDARAVSYAPYRHVCTVCAERAAIAKQQTEMAARTKRILAVAVASDYGGPCTPCGICRQVLREFCALHVPVLMPSSIWEPHSPRDVAPRTVDDLAEEDMLVTTLEHLLPYSFGPEALSTTGAK
ncbi:cytidine deaminase [Malassezia sp. CBS 17886]|nr:cytidine deaminase [Malassezia sp. CBS 17886]